MSTLETNLVQPSTGTTLTLGASGDTVDIPSGATLDVTGATLSGLYETGTWTPVFAGSGTAGSFTYTAQVGHYTKIANVVIAQFRVTISAISVAAAGYLYIQGLPENAYEYPGITIGYATGFTAGDTPTGGYMSSGSSNMELMRYDAADARNGMSTHSGGTALTATSSILGNIVYRTSAT